MKFSESEVVEFCAKLVHQELKVSNGDDSEDTCDFLSNETLSKSGEIIAYCVALAKAVLAGNLSDETVLKGNQAVHACVVHFEEFATLRQK